MVTLSFSASNDKKRRNSTKKMSMSASVPALIKDEIDIFHPIFRVNTNNNAGDLAGTNLFSCCECYCAEFKRYYWITGVTHITTCVYDISCETDVLATFIDDIKDTTAFVEYSASAGSFVPDNRFPRTYSSNLVGTELPLTDCNSVGTFILQVASSKATCGMGLLETYAINRGILKEIATQLYDPDFIKKITNTFSDPTTALGCCTWIPLKEEFASYSESVPIMFNDVNMGSGAVAKKTYSKDLGTILLPELHKTTITDSNGNKINSWADYRNFPPYTEYYLFLPGVGLTELPFQEIFGDGTQQPQIKVFMEMSIPTGDVLYRIVRLNIAKPGDVNTTIMTVAGRLGVNIPTSSYQNGIGSAISSAVATGASLATMYFAPLSAPYMAGTAINTAFSAVTNLPKSSMSVSGNLGSFISSITDLNRVIAIRVQYETTDTPWAASTIMGMPLFMHKKLGTLSGYVKCKNAFVSSWCSSGELDTINAYLNGEGVFLE